MTAFPDIKLIALAVGVIALFAWFFWHVAATYVGTARRFANWLDTGAERQRARIEHENRFGKPPLWLRAARAVMIVIIFAGAGALVFWKLRIR